MNLYNVLNVFEVIEFSQYAYIFCHLIGMTSASINPIMYGKFCDCFCKCFIRVSSSDQRLFSHGIFQHASTGFETLH